MCSRLDNILDDYIFGGIPIFVIITETTSLQYHSVIYVLHFAHFYKIANITTLFLTCN